MFNSGYPLQVITDDQGTAICKPNMGNHSSNVISVQDWNTYNIMMVLLQYPIPLFIISLTYGHMARVIQFYKNVSSCIIFKEHSLKIYLYCNVIFNNS